jgi:Tfp pilus assembly protein PilF
MTILHGRTLWAAALATLILGTASAAPVPAAPTDEALKEKALKLNDSSTPDAMQAKLTELLKDKTAAKRLVVLAAKMQADAKEKDAPFKFNAAFILGKAAQNLKDYKTAEAFYKFCKANALKLESGEKTARAYDGLIDLYWDQKKFAEVEELCAELLASEDTGKEMSSAKSFAIERMIQSKARRGDHDEALNMADAVIKLEKGGWYSLQLKGYVLREAGKIDQAIETYTEVLKKLEADKKLEGKEKSTITRNVRYMLTGLHVENKAIDKAADILKELVKEVPDSATYKNDLGFIWADNDLKLEESEKLIREALDLDKKAREKALKEGKIDAEDAKKANAAYQDSLGWVLYKNKKYDEAIKLLTEASLDEEEGQHMEIWDHLADAYLAKMDAKKAVELWSKALKFEDVSKRDGERRKKITEKMRKAKASLKGAEDKDK